MLDGWMVFQSECAWALGFRQLLLPFDRYHGEHPEDPQHLLPKVQKTHAPQGGGTCCAQKPPGLAEIKKIIIYIYIYFFSIQIFLYLCICIDLNIKKFRGPFPIANPFSSRFWSKFFGLGFLEILGLRGLQVGTPMSQIEELTHVHQEPESLEKFQPSTEWWWMNQVLIH